MTGRPRRSAGPERLSRHHPGGFRREGSRTADVPESHGAAAFVWRVQHVLRGLVRRKREGWRSHCRLMFRSTVEEARGAPRRRTAASSATSPPRPRPRPSTCPTRPTQRAASSSAATERVLNVASSDPPPPLPPIFFLPRLLFLPRSQTSSSSSPPGSFFRLARLHSFKAISAVPRVPV